MSEARDLHEYGFALERVGEALVFRDPQGRVVPAQGPRWEVAVDLAAVAGAWSGSGVARWEVDRGTLRA